jgi:hypothetical protein
VVQELTQADQVYVCLWSHANGQPVQIHFVVQPVPHEMRESASQPGPALQAAMFQDGHLPDTEAVEACCRKARERLTINL